MSTRSQICFEAASGEVTVNYCHFDGYPGGVGMTLLKNYTDLETVKALIALGSISSLGASIGEKHLYEDHDLAQKMGWTTAYHRDRGEPLETTIYESRKHFVEANNSEEYSYLFSEAKNMWLWRRSNGKKFTKFTERSKE
jgi:hypothetical protein